MFSSLAIALPDGPEIVSALPVIVSLIIIEGLLSVDNALAIAAMASHLPEKQKYRALQLGIFGAYLFRGLALAVAAWILKTPWVMWAGAAYLIYLMSHHFTGQGDADGDGKPDPNETRGFFATIVAIEIMDLSLSVDNVVAAAAMDRRLWVVCTGVFIGILALRLVAGACIKLIEKYPVLGHVAFLLIGYVGFLLVAELIADSLYPHDPVGILKLTEPDPETGLQHHHLPSVWKFAGIVSIMTLAIAWSRSPMLQKVFAPVISAAGWPMKLADRVVGTVLTVLIYPVKLLIRAFRPAPPPANGAA